MTMSCPPRIQGRGVASPLPYVHHSANADPATRHPPPETRLFHSVLYSALYTVLNSVLLRCIPCQPANLSAGQLTLPLSVQPSLWASEPLVSHVPLPTCPLALRRAHLCTGAPLRFAPLHLGRLGEPSLPQGTRMGPLPLNFPYTQYSILDTLGSPLPRRTPCLAPWH